MADSAARDRSGGVYVYHKLRLRWYQKDISDFLYDCGCERAEFILAYR